MTLENSIKTPAFWLRLGGINHAIALAVIALGCACSGFSCSGESMKDVMSLYAFTLLTPQLALFVITLIALFLVTTSLRQIYAGGKAAILFTASLGILILFAYWQ